jgi:ferredoxin-NADP reductase
MHVREHASQHDRIGDLPLVTESATVSDVTAMDHDRRPEIRETVRRWLRAERLLDEYAPGTTVEEWERLRTSLADAGHWKLARKVAAVADRGGRPKPMLVSTRFRTDREFEHLAGQYVGVRYDRAARAYSIASSPTRDHVEICVRRVPDGRLSPRICGDLAAGDRVTLRGPHGDLVLQEPSTRDQVFLATGTGAAPFKSMIDYVFEEGRDVHDGVERDVWLFLGAAWEDDLPYRAAFRERASDHENFHFVPTLSREAYLSDWSGETAYVQNAFLKHVDETAVTTAVDERVATWLRRTPESGVSARIDPASADIYACGVNAMVYSLLEAVESIGVPQRHVESEGFG